MDWLNKWMCNSRIVSLALISHWIWVLYLQLPPGHVCIAIKAYVWHHAPRESPNFETNFLVTYPFFVTSSFVDTFFHLISKYSQTESWCTSELGAALSELWDRHIHKSLQTKRLCRIECYVRVYTCTLNCVQLWNTMDYSPPGSPSIGFPRQEYLSGLPFPPPGDLPDPGIKPASPVSSALIGRFFPLSHLGSPEFCTMF